MSDTDLSGRWKPCRGEGAIAAMHEFLWQRRRGKRSDWEWSSYASSAIAAQRCSQFERWLPLSL
jgi:hypothetical protein